MIPYLFLIGAALLFSFQFIFAKRYERKSNGKRIASLWMLFFMGFWAFLIFFVMNGFRFEASATAWGVSLAYTATCFLCNICSQTALGLGKIGLMNLYMQVGGQLIPFLYGLLCGDKPVVWAWIGFALMLVSFVPTLIALKRDGKPGEKSNVLFLVLITVCGVLNGLVGVFTDMNAKLPEGVKASENDFLILFGLLSMAMALVSVVLYAVIGRVRKGRFDTSVFHIARSGDRSPKAFIGLSLIMLAYMLLNGFANVCSLNAAAVLDASIQFPLLGALILILTPIWGRVFYKEKITKLDALSVGLASAGVLMYMVEPLLVIFGL